EVLARLRLLGQEVLQPGETGWLQLELREPVVVIRGDRYVLRRPSPGETLGGGVIVDPRPKGRHKRFDDKVLSGLQAMAEGSPADIFQQALLALGAASYQDVLARSTLAADLAHQALAELLAAGQALILDGNPDQVRSDTLLAGRAYWEHLRQKVISAIGAYHHKYPLRFGMPREELKSRLKIPVRIYNLLIGHMQAEGDLLERSVRPQTPGASSVPLLSEPGHNIRLSPEQQVQADRLLAVFERQPSAPPSVKESIAEVGEDVYAALLDLGQLLQVSDEVVFRTQDFDRIVAQIRAILTRTGTISVAQVRDHFNTSRRYVLALLEYLDAVGLTVRDGDVRKLNPKAS
ncbi:MAG: SelB C-terminal domain-containing protein, partial [Anaerolineales bacterium]|nr:SelB C-terminal domain-containing protein [Anaerolineales bacterium]